jgi:hypothetical protein
MAVELHACRSVGESHGVVRSRLALPPKQFAMTDQLPACTWSRQSQPIARAGQADQSSSGPRLHPMVRLSDELGRHAEPGAPPDVETALAKVTLSVETCRSASRRSDPVTSDTSLILISVFTARRH